MRLVLGLVALALLALGVFVATRPDRFHIERSATMQAPTEAIFPHIDDFKQWGAWSPWEKVDPQMQRSYDGPPRGVGARYAWQGNKDIGKGRMEITEATAPRKVVIALEFIEPFAASNVATFTLTPDGAGTRVTWAMDGANALITKLMSLVMNMDTMIGGEFEKGLASLTAIVEAERR